MFKSNLKLTHLITAVILTLGLSISFQSLLAAWTAPTAAPPGNNVGEPLNSGPGWQMKSGDLAVLGKFIIGALPEVLYVDTENESIGINKTPDHTKYALDVNGDVNFDNDIYQNGSLLTAGYWDKAADDDIYYNGHQVGIGLINPDFQLTLQQERDDLSGPNTQLNPGLSVINTGQTGYSRFWTDSSGYARISGSNDGEDENKPIILNGEGTGWVGINKIGTLNAELDVNGVIRVKNTLESHDNALNLSGRNWGMNFYIDSDNNSSDNYIFNGNGSEIMRITDTGNVGIGDTSPDAKFDVEGQIVGGFGAQTTGGTEDWNHLTNTRSGSGYTLLNGDDANGPSAAGGNYFHPFNFEYSSKSGTGNISQLAIPYGNSASIDQGIYIRGRYSGTWSNWAKIISENTSGNVGIGTNNPGTNKLEVVGGPIKATDGLIIETRASDPAGPAVGQMWLIQ